VARGRVSIAVLEAALADRAPGVADVPIKLSVGGKVEGFRPFEDAHAEPATFSPEAPTHARDLILVYFTSGTTSRPKLVGHTHASYPVGHLSTLYWLGVREGDVHLNVSSPGWAKHAWSSFFAPWNAGATVVVQRAARFDPKATLDLVVRAGVTTLCAPPTVWRLLVQQDLAAFPVKLREVTGAGEPLNPEIIERVRRAWGLTIRDGYGQTETTAQIGNTPGVPVEPGSMGRPLPGYPVALLDQDGRASDQGEIALSLEPRPLGLMTGYADDEAKTREVFAGGFYRTGDTAWRDAAGRYWFVGRSDDVFKSSDYRISPFELESALIEHPAIGEAAVVPSPDPIRLAVPKAFVSPRAGFVPTPELARDVLRFVNARLAPYKRVRRLEFAELPKTISGKIRRVELRVREQRKTERALLEFWEEDFPELRGAR
jgi:acetyl-CoA synthetase